MTDTLEEYCAEYLPHADLHATVDDIRPAVSPYIGTENAVTFTALEDYHRLLGPADPLLDLMNVTSQVRTQMRPAPMQNISQPAHILNHLLRLNQSNLSDPELWRAKQAILLPEPGSNTLI